MQKERYRVEYRRARVDARAAALALDDCLKHRRPLRDVARAAERAKLAAARLYTAAACIISPP